MYRHMPLSLLLQLQFFESYKRFSDKTKKCISLIYHCCTLTMEFEIVINYYPMTLLLIHLNDSYPPRSFYSFHT